jgi:hypothetical protein
VVAVDEGFGRTDEKANDDESGMASDDNDSQDYENDKE